LTNRSVSRRKFLQTAGLSLSAPYVIPSSALGREGHTPPSETVHLGVIGTGGKGIGGMANFMRCQGARVAAVCDVEAGARAHAATIAGLADKDAHSDFRELLARDDIDAVLITTPDHWHALQAVAAVRAGKDVYCEKPLSNTITEGRAIADAVERHGAVFQHGSQLRSMPGTRKACELVRNGYIGELTSVTIGSPPGLETGHHEPEPVPQGFDYDMWLGPAPYAPYTPWRVKVPGRLPCWYFISDYSKAGWVAGYGVHDVDIAHWGMGTEHTGPVEVEGEGIYPADGLWDTVLTYRLEFRYANGVTITMTDTGQNPHGVRFTGTEGSVFTRGRLRTQPEWLADVTIKPSDVRLYESRFHEQNFIDCVKSRRPTLTPAEAAHRSTSAALIGGLALQLGRKLRWDPQAERFENDEEANRMLSYAMREPWNA
jgi:predicted dehydrogenase